jgi:hypothetical protein
MLDPAHDFHTPLPDFPCKERGFGKADPVLTAHGPAHLKRGIYQFFYGSFYTHHLHRITLIGENSGVEIAVTGVAEGAYPEVVIRSNPLDPRNHLAQTGQGDGHIFKNGGGLCA